MPSVITPTPQTFVQVALPLASCTFAARLAARYADGSIVPFLIALAWLLGVAIQLGTRPRWTKRGAAERYFVLPFVVTATALVLTGATVPTDSTFWSVGESTVAVIFRDVRDIALPVALWASLLVAGFAAFVLPAKAPTSTPPVPNAPAVPATARRGRPTRRRSEPDIPF